jgi:hypothetical protein
VAGPRWFWLNPGAVDDGQFYATVPHVIPTLLIVLALEIRVSSLSR